MRIREDEEGIKKEGRMKAVVALASRPVARGGRETKWRRQVHGCKDSPHFNFTPVPSSTSPSTFELVKAGKPSWSLVESNV